MAEAGRSGKAGARRELFVGGLHLAALSVLAVAQPLFDVLEPAAGFFVARGSRPADLVALVVAVIVGPPLGLVALEAIAGLAGRSLRRGVHLVLVGLLAALFLLPPLRRPPVAAQSALWLAPAFVAGALAALVYGRWKPARSFLTVLAPVSLLFPALFLSSAAMRTILAPPDEPPSPAATVEATTTVVLVIFDELPLASLMTPELRIDATLFPNFARLAGESTWFRNATSSNFLSLQVIPSIMTGRAPSAQRSVELGRRIQPTAADHPNSIFTLLAGSHRLRVQETLTAVCPPSLLARPAGEAFGARMRSLWDDLSLVYAHVVLPGSLAARLPSVDENWSDFRRRAAGGSDARGESGRGSTARTEYFRDFIASIDADPRPALYFLHILYPHTPWNRLPGGRRYEALQPFPGHARLLWGADEGPPGLAYQQHLLQLGHTDALLGELLDRMEAQGVYESSLVVVLGDHGASFRAGEERRKATATNVRDIVHVPLFVKEPFQAAGRVSDRNVESIDVLPTIADVLGVELPWVVDGQSALGESVPARPDKVMHAGPGPMMLDAALPAEWPALELKQRLFGPRPSWEELFAIGARRALLGRPVAELGPLETLAARAHLQGAERFAAVDTRAPSLPCCLVGRLGLEPDAPLPAEVALVLNGVIRSVAPTFERTAAGAAFVAMLPDAAFVDGANEVRVLAVLDGGRLAWIPSFGYRLVAARGGQPARIVRSDGRAHELREDALGGHVDAAAVEGGVLRMEGWAADVGRLRPAEALVLVVGDGRVLSVPTGLARADLPAAFGGERAAAMGRAGFRLACPLDAPDGAAPRDLRLFALGPGVAAELPLPR